MENNPLISIIVPVYNVEKYLDKCLFSIRNQTYKNIQIVIVNDGSTDGSLNICLKHSKADKRIILINQENKGLSEARNSGIKNATGEYLSFVDSDDFISADFINTHIFNLLKYKSDISMCCFFNINENDSKSTPEYIINKKIDVRIFKRQKAFKLLISGKIQSFACNKVFKKELFSDIRFPVNKCYEDVYVMHSIFYKSNNFCLINKPLYFYLNRTKSITHNPSQKNIDDFFDSNFERIRFLNEKKFNALAAVCLFNLNNYSINYKTVYKDINYQKIDDSIKCYRKKLTILGKIYLIILSAKKFFLRCIYHLKRMFKN